MSLADVVVCDTNAHKKYFENKFNIPQRKLKVIPVGVNTEEFKPTLITPNTGKFIVGFYGSFIPLHGTKFIVEAAKILSGYQDIHFTLIGEGFEFKQTKTLALDTYGLTNISFPGWVDYASLNDHIASFDIALGIFGETLKTDLVIPNKIFHYAALQKAIITKVSPAIREIFEDGVNLILTDSNPEKIAESILELYTNCEQKNRIAVNGYDKVSKGYNHIETAKKLIQLACRL